MKKICALLVLTISLSSLTAFSQNGDLEIAQALIGQKYSQLDSILSKFDIEYYITHDKKSFEKDATMHIYIAKGNESIRLWKLKIGDINYFRSNEIIQSYQEVCTEVFVRYRHSNLNDLRDFMSYDVPENAYGVTYEKKQGTDMSHFQISRKTKYVY